MEDGRHVRDAHFVERSLLPTSAACLVAGGVRETLAALFGRAVHVRVTEPTLPSRPAWSVIVSNATIYRVPGRIADAAIVLGSNDALALATSAFGELACEPRSLSSIEKTVLDRALKALATSVASLCGTREGAPVLLADPDLADFSTYFELLVEAPNPCRIAIALSQDPIPTPGAHLQIEDLGEIEVELEVYLYLAPIDASALLGLQPGAFLPMKNATAPFDARADLAGWPIGYGEGGVGGMCYAFALDEREPRVSQRIKEHR